MGTEGDHHGSTRPDMTWHHTTGYGGNGNGNGDRDSSSGGYPDDRYPTRPGAYPPGPPGIGMPGRPGMWNGGPPGPGDYGEIEKKFFLK